MAQRGSIYPIDENATSGTDLARLLEQTEGARNTADAGSTRPTYLLAGGIWTKDLGGGAFELQLFDGVQDIPVGTSSGAVAPFSESATYAVNDLVAYQGDIYMAVAGHSGPWDNANFIKQTLSAGGSEGEVYRWNATTKRWEAGTEFRITPTGNVGIRQPSPLVALHVGELTDTSNTFRLEATYPIILLQTGTSGEASIRASKATAVAAFSWSAVTDSWSLRSAANSTAIKTFDNGYVNIGGYGSQIYTLIVNGQIASTASSGIIKISDQRFKENVTPLSVPAVDLLDNLNPVSFDFIEDFEVLGKVVDPETGGLVNGVVREKMGFPDVRQMGFIAQEVEAAVLAYTDVYPSMLNTKFIPALIDAAGTEKEAPYDLKLMDDSKLIPILVKAVQELSTRVTALEAQVAALTP